MKKTPDTLILRVTASFTSVIGYGYLYKCMIDKVISGDFSETQINVTILASDETNYNFILTHLNPIKFEMVCKKNKTDEPYFLMPISGFVDKNKTSWEIEVLRETSS